MAWLHSPGQVTWEKEFQTREEAQKEARLLASEYKTQVKTRKVAFFTWEVYTVSCSDAIDREAHSLACRCEACSS